MGLILNQYEKLIDINLKLKLIKNFVQVNYTAVQQHPEILEKFSLNFNNITLKFSTDESSLIHIIISDTDDFILHYLYKVKSIEHFYFENTVILKILGIYEGWDSTYMLDTKTGNLKRLVNPFRIVKTNKEDQIGVLKNAKVRAVIKNGVIEPVPGSLTPAAAQSRFEKLFG